MTTSHDVAARALYDLTISHLHVQEGTPPVESGRLRSWDDLPESGRRTYGWRVDKAAASETFEDYYQWMTMIERTAAPTSMFAAMYGQPPAADEDTERTRGHRAEYYLVRHLLGIEDAVLSQS